MQLEVHRAASSRRTRGHFSIQHFPSSMQPSCNCAWNLKAHSHSLTQFEGSLLAACPQCKRFLSPSVRQGKISGLPALTPAGHHLDKGPAASISQVQFLPRNAALPSCRPHTPGPGGRSGERRTGGTLRCGDAQAPEHTDFYKLFILGL